jgi:hypothetical protein
MSCYAVTIDLPCYILGDSYLGLGGFGPIIIDDLQPSDPLLRCVVTFSLADETFTLDTDAGESPDHLMTITDEDTWEVESTEIDDFLPTKGAWNWEAEFYSVYFGEKLTLYKGTLIV